MRALSAKEIGYLEDHFIESVTENWRYFRLANYIFKAKECLFAQNQGEIFQRLV